MIPKVVLDCLFANEYKIMFHLILFIMSSHVYPMSVSNRNCNIKLPLGYTRKKDEGKQKRYGKYIEYKLVTHKLIQCTPLPHVFRNYVTGYSDFFKGQKRKYQNKSYSSD